MATVAVDPFPPSVGDVTMPGKSLITITPSDTNEITSVVRQIYVGGAGSVALVDTAGNTTTHVGVIAGSYIGPFRVKQVLATGTTATFMIGYV